MEVIVKEKVSVPTRQNSEDQIGKGGLEEVKESTENQNDQEIEKAMNLGLNDFEIEKLNFLVLRSENSLESDLKKHVEEYNRPRIPSKVSIFSAFKSTKDYFIAEYGAGYAIFVEGKMKERKQDESKK